MYRDEFDRLLDAFEAYASHDLTLYKLSLGARDAETGWRAKTFDSGTTIEGIFATRGASPQTLPLGTYVKYDAVLVTADGVAEGGEIKDAFDNWWEVKAYEDVPQGNSFSHRIVHLSKLTLQHGATNVDTAAPSYTLSSDPRYRVKYLLDREWTRSNALDDNGNGLGVQTLYAYPPYPLELELKEPSVIDVLIPIDQPRSTPLMDPGTKAPCGYREQVPVELVCMDKSDVTATKAMYQAEAELRNVLEENPTGSLRCLREAAPSTRHLGSPTLWSAKYVWDYRRDTVT